MTNRRIAAFSPILAALLLIGCGKSGNDDEAAANANGFVPPRALPATPLAGQTPDTPVTAYVGKHPNDPVGGVLFFDRTDVAQALLEAVPDNRIRAHFREQKTGERPIAGHGREIVATGCEGADCTARNWAFRFDPGAQSGTACYHDSASMGDTSRWFSHGTASTKPGACPLP